MDSYARLSRAQLSFDYLHTNSTTHEFLFGAIAELIDNARDAGATEIDIFSVKNPALRGGFLLYFIDNGCGMSPEEAKNVIVFGKSFKRSQDQSSIGMYGNGLKSGSMRIGNDMILFTKRDGIFSCVFLSRTFHEAEKLDEVIVPLPTFKVKDRSPNVSTPEEQKKHDIEMRILYTYSPFQSAKDFFSQFDKIKGESGTVVIIYNMKLLDNGSTELDVITDPRDILLANISDKDDPLEPLTDIELPLEKRSLRAYVSVLYANPRMKVYIQSRKVQTKRLLDTLYRVRRYNYASKTFRTRAERELARAKEEVKIAEMVAKESESKAKDCEMRYEGTSDPEHLKLIRRLNSIAAEKRAIVATKQNTVARKQKSLKDPKTLTFYFGLNVVNRACDGMFVYNCSRLIKMYQRIGPQQDSSMTCRGVVGIVDVPYMVLEPTHNKQDFADAKEFRQLMRAMADHLMQYWDDMAIEKDGPDDISRFWKHFGYLSARWRDPPSDEEKYARRRCSCVSLCVQCDKCLKWRVLPFSKDKVGRDVPDSWQCKDNTDQKHRSCDTPEQDMSPELGVLKRKIKTKEQRQAELEAQIRKKQEELELIREPDEEEPAVRTLTKRPAHQPLPPSQPAKRRSTQATSSTLSPTPPNPSQPRTITVADRKRMNSSQLVDLAGRKNLKSVTVNASASRSSGRQSTAASTLKSKGAPAAKPRRLVLHDSSESEEDEVFEEEKSAEESEGERRTVKKTLKAKPAKPNTTTSPSKLSTAAVPAQKTLEQNATEVIDYGEVEKKSVQLTSVKETAGGSTKPVLLNGATSSKGSEDMAKSSETSVTGDSTLDKRINDKLKACLRYFLPPKWPVEKDRIHLLSEAELAEFPLDKFFELYENGLRKLLAGFQDETQNVARTLQSLRTDVVKLLDKVAPELNASVGPIESVDQVLREYLNQDP